VSVGHAQLLPGQLDPARQVADLLMRLANLVGAGLRGRWSRVSAERAVELPAV
jgi:hypothetical protein